MSQTNNALLTISEHQIEDAYHWLCRQRKNYPPNSDIWAFRFSWQNHKDDLLKQVIHGDYLFSPMKKITKANGKTIHLWSAQDALVMKVLSELLTNELTLPETCTHIKNHLGLKKSVTSIQQNLKNYKFVCKTDVKQFYESIDQYLLMEQIHQHIENKILKRYLWQVIHRCVEHGGLYREIKQGISRGCSLSPILGALYLKKLDEQFAQADALYLRYMDDIIILTTSRWKNRRAVKLMNECFEQLNVKQHPDKTYIGKIEKGFDFLGYHFSRHTIQLAKTTLKKHLEKYHRLYEQQQRKKATTSEVTLILDDYLKRWRRWCTAGLVGITTSFVDEQSLSLQYLDQAMLRT